MTVSQTRKLVRCSEKESDRVAGKTTRRQNAATRNTEGERKDESLSSDSDYEEQIQQQHQVLCMSTDGKDDDNAYCLLQEAS